MSENPRARLKSLMDGLELPKGFKLTPAREDALRALGMMMLGHKDNKLTCWGSVPSFSHIQGRYHAKMSTSAKAALRGMAKAGWVKAKPPEPSSTRWAAHTVEFQPGLEQLALRLGARRKLWEERKEHSLDDAREAYTEMRDRLWKARAIISNAVHNPIVGENDVLEAYRQLRELTLEVFEAEQKLADVKAHMEEVPEPTEDEAFVWLMERKLNGPKTD